MLDSILDECERRARAGWEEIANGAWWRDMLPDAVFTQICPPEFEDAVIEAMVDSERWMRTSTGFNLRTPERAHQQ